MRRISIMLILQLWQNYYYKNLDIHFYKLIFCLKLFTFIFELHLKLDIFYLGSQ